MKKLIFMIFLMPFFVFANGYGIATLVKGSVQVIKSDGKNKILKRGDKVFESDTIVTASKSVIRVVMVDTNIIDVYPNSKVLIKQYIYSPQEDNKNVKLEVASGQIKSTVKQKYDNEKNKFNIKTPAIVAGVRGTIFTTEHELQTGISRVFTHEGNVMVGKTDLQGNIKEFFSVKANQRIQIDKNTEKPEVLETAKPEIQRLKEVDKNNGLERISIGESGSKKDNAVENGQKGPVPSNDRGSSPDRNENNQEDRESSDEKTVNKGSGSTSDNNSNKDKNDREDKKEVGKDNREDNREDKKEVSKDREIKKDRDDNLENNKKSDSIKSYDDGKKSSINAEPARQEVSAPSHEKDDGKKNSNSASGEPARQEVSQPSRQEASEPQRPEKEAIPKSAVSSEDHQTEFKKRIKQEIKNRRK